MSSDESEEEEIEAPSIPNPRVAEVKPEAESSPKVSPRAEEQEVKKEEVAKVKQEVDEVKQEVPETKQEEEISSDEDVELKSGDQRNVVVEKSEDNENITNKGDTQHSDQPTEGTKAKSEAIEVKSEDTSAIENSEVTNKVSEDSASKVGKYDDFEVPSFSPMEPPPMDDSISDNSGEEKVDDNK